MFTTFFMPPLPASTHPPWVWVDLKHPSPSLVSPDSVKLPVMFGRSEHNRTSLRCKSLPNRSGKLGCIDGLDVWIERLSSELEWFVHE